MQADIIHGSFWSRPVVAISKALWFVARIFFWVGLRVISTWSLFMTWSRMSVGALSLFVLVFNLQHTCVEIKAVNASPCLVELLDIL